MVAVMEGAGAGWKGSSMADYYSGGHRSGAAGIAGVRMVWGIVTSWTATVTAFLAVALWWALQVFPAASFYYEARSMIVPDLPHGADVVMLVDREVKRPVYGRWTVTVRRYEGGGWVMACAPARGSSDYSPQASLPDPLTLDWWTEGQCEITEPGRYFITTTWAFEPRRLPGTRRSVPLVSNVFAIAEIEATG